MVAQYRAIWTAPGGGTGYSVFHFTTAGASGAAQTIADDTREFFLGLQSALPDDVIVSFDSEVLDMDPSGTLQAVWGVTPGADVNGSITSGYARAQGARVDWATDQVVAGRRLTGRTYVVPVGSVFFDTQGLLTSAAVTDLQNAANAFISDTASNRPLRVWSRTHAVDSVVTAASIPTQGAILRGRRD